MTPLLMKLLAGEFIAVNVWAMMLDIMQMIILPIIAGFIFNMLYSGKDKWKHRLMQLGAYFVIFLLTGLIAFGSGQADAAGSGMIVLKSIGLFCILPSAGAWLLKLILKGDRKAIEAGLSFLSMAGIAVIITIITANGRDQLLVVGALLLVTSLIHNVAGYLFGYGTAYVFGMSERDRRTVALEVGMQNGGLASGLAMKMASGALVGLAPAIFGPMMNVTGSILASFWRARPPKEKTGYIKTTDK
jgi:BASS family bile acid:Na+ symporter